MGALVNAEQRADVQGKVNILLAAGCEIRLGGQADFYLLRRLLPANLIVLSAAG